MLNFGFERFHTARSIDGAVHEFELGTVRNLPAPDEIHWPVTPKRTRDRRIVLWRTMFPGRHYYASVFQDAEFRSLPKHLETGSELRNLLEAAIEKIPIGRPLPVKGGPVGINSGQATVESHLDQSPTIRPLSKWESERMSELIDPRQQGPEEAGFTEIVSGPDDLSAFRLDFPSAPFKRSAAVDT